MLVGLVGKQIGGKEEGELTLSRWETEWGIAKEILQPKEKNGTPARIAAKIMEDFTSFIKKEQMTGIANHIGTKPIAYK